MRYLKVFEEWDDFDKEDYISNVKDNIKDILLSFTDDGFKVDLYSGRTATVPYININISPKKRIHPNGSMTKEDQITVTQDMIDDLYRLKEYMGEVGFNVISQSNVGYFATPNGKPIPKSYEVNYGRGWLTVYAIDIQLGRCTRSHSDGSESILGYDIISISLVFKISPYYLVHKEVEVDGKLVPLHKILF